MQRFNVQRIVSATRFAVGRPVATVSSRSLFSEPSRLAVISSPKTSVQWKKPSFAFSRTASNTSAAAQIGQTRPEPDIFQKDYFHMSSIALVTLIPAALVLSPSMINFPIDLALGFLMPLHGHLGMQLVLKDYLPGKAWAQILLWLATFAATFGLFRINISGDGIAETLKSLWRKPGKSDAGAQAKKH